jgi:hypothetical protein
MDIQTVLQHVFGIIGICTVVVWLRDRVFSYMSNAWSANKKKSDLFKARAINLIKLLRDDTPMHRVPDYVPGACIQCRCVILSPLRSLNVKKCTSCGYEMDWNLDPGQMPLVRSNRMVKRNED